MRSCQGGLVKVKVMETGKKTRVSTMRSKPQTDPRTDLGNGSRRVALRWLALLPWLPLGACGYPQSFIDALGKFELAMREKAQSGALILISIDNLPMIMSGYSMAVAEAVMNELHVLLSTHNPNGTTARAQRDQFGILLPECNAAKATQWCHEIEQAIRSYSYHSRYGELHCVISSAHHIVPD